MKARFETSKHDLIFADNVTTLTIAKEWAFPEFFLGQVLEVSGVFEVITKVEVGTDSIVGYAVDLKVTCVPSTGVVTLAARAQAQDL